MNRLWRTLCLAGCLAWAPGAPAADVPPPAAAAAGQVLVMLHLPAPHYRPDASYAGAYADASGHGARRRIARDLARRHGLTLLSDWPMPELGIDCYVMQVPPDVAPAQIVARLEQDPRVEWAQPMRLFHALDGHDPLYAAQPSAQFWHIGELHRYATGRNVRVALIDSGVDADHPDLAGQVVLQQNFVDDKPYAAETHGTAVAGIVAAVAGNGIGIEGVAPGARLLALRACWEQAPEATLCNSFTLGKALNFALMHKAQVINLSLSGPQDRLLQRLLDVAIERGVAVVAALDPQQAGGGFPASHPGVLAVGAEGQGAALFAPGQDIPSTAPGGGWCLVSGASFAAAHVSGLLALLSELRPGQGGAVLRRELFVSGGAIDACASIARASGACLCSCTPVLAAKAKLLPP